MIIRICKQEDPFARVDKQMLQDERLSWKAKGILAYLLGQRDDWEIQIEDLVAKSTNGRDSVYAAMKELRAFGYAKIETIRRAGRMWAKNWVVSDRPLDTGFPYQGKSDLVNPHVSKNDDTSKNNTRLRPVALNGNFGLNGESKLDKCSPTFQLVKRFAQFSKVNLYHIVKKDPTTQLVVYAAGANQGGWKEHTIRSWQMSCEVLLKKYKFQKVDAVLEWYIKNHDDEWVPSCRTMTRFCEKFESIEKAMRRAAHSNGESTEPEEKLVYRPVVVNGKKVMWPEYRKNSEG